YQPELAYFECLHELKLIVDMIYAQGIQGMWNRVSETARYGGLTRGERIITKETRAEMRRILEEIRSGRFAKEWINECQAGRPVFKALLAKGDRHLIELVGARLRSMMPWITQAPLSSSRKRGSKQTPSSTRSRIPASAGMTTRRRAVTRAKVKR
ncbi:MAG: hypothetical protein HYZ95_01770, partial [Candidatus Omnitrophica bacterium]|nr:hypothetical protein [Candidatus Omnitrophota bacterium]